MRDISSTLVFWSQDENNSSIIWKLTNYSLSLQRQIVDIMSYTKDPIVINNPSKELLEVVKNLKERKRSKLEKLRNMKPEEFSCRIIL